MTNGDGASLDHVRIFDKTLTQTEVEILSNERIDIPKSEIFQDKHTIEKGTSVIFTDRHGIKTNGSIATFKDTHRIEQASLATIIIERVNS